MPKHTTEHSASRLRNSSAQDPGTVSRSATLSRGACAAHASTQIESLSCTGRCLCSCHCASSSLLVADAGPAASPPPSPSKLHGFIGTLKKKFSQMMKRDLPTAEHHVDRARQSQRTRSSDGACSSRSASRSRTLPRNLSTATGSGPSTPAGLVDCAFDTLEHRRSRSLRRHRTKTREVTATVAGGPLSPSQFRRIIARSPHGEAAYGLQDITVPPQNECTKRHADSPRKCMEDAQAVVVDTGYGHTSAPVVVDVDADSGELAVLLSGPLAPFYDQVKESAVASSGWCLTRELFKLSKYGWYWGPITRAEAEERLAGQPDGAFLLRDSSDDRYLLSLSFRSDGKTLHTRIEHCNGLFSFYAHPESEGYSSVVDLIERSMSDSQSGVFCYSRARTPGSPSFPVRLARPVSRFTYVRSLQYLCRFVIRQHTRVDYIQKLPLPTSIKGWLEETQY